MDTIINAILNIFENLTNLKFGKELLVFIISALPILELRGGLLAASLLKLSPLKGYILSLIGNILPVPLLLMFMSKILKWMENSNIKFLKKIATSLNKKVTKNRKTIDKYGYLGLTLFVGIPLPGTGAFTGSLISTALNMDKKKSFLYTVIGIFIASIIMMIISYGLLGNLLN